MADLPEHSDRQGHLEITVETNGPRRNHQIGRSPFIFAGIEWRIWGFHIREWGKGDFPFANGNLFREWESPLKKAMAHFANGPLHS